MKKFIHGFTEFVRRHVRAFAVVLGLVGSSAFAEGSSASITPTSYTVPTAVNTAINDLAGAADGYATVILPYIAYVGLAFIGIAVVYLLFKVFRRFVGGK